MDVSFGLIKTAQNSRHIIIIFVMKGNSYFGAIYILKSLIFHNFASLFRLNIIKEDTGEDGMEPKKD